MLTPTGPTGLMPEQRTLAGKLPHPTLHDWQILFWGCTKWHNTFIARRWLQLTSYRVLCWSFPYYKHGDILSAIYERAVLVLVLIALHLAHLDCIENTDALIFSKKWWPHNLLLKISSMLKSQLWTEWIVNGIQLRLHILQCVFVDATFNWNSFSSIVSLHQWY